MLDMLLLELTGIPFTSRNLKMKSTDREEDDYLIWAYEYRVLKREYEELKERNELLMLELEQYQNLITDLKTLLKENM